MQVVILAGGKGTRLKPFTTILPKPLIPVGERPILEIVLLQLKAAGFKEYIFSVGYLAALIEAYFGDGGKWGIKIRYSREAAPLGTAGPLAIIKGLAPEFLVMNGDILCNMDYRKFFKYHLKAKNDITICSFAKKVKIDLGVLKIRDNILQDYIEKPEYQYDVSMGVYGIRRKLISTIPKRKHYDLPDLIMDQKKKGANIGIYQFKGEWLDIGRIEDHQIAQNIMAEKEDSYLGKKARRGNR